jgi:predicted esterase
MSDPVRHLVEATVHGRVLVRSSPTRTAHVLVGFHGYAETATVALERLARIPGSDGWTLIAIQALNRFYRGRTAETVAGWMTHEDREAVIGDNVRYVDAALDAVLRGHEVAPLIMVGFSQGVAMAFRAAVRGRRRSDGVIAAGGDVPPELLEDAAALFPPVVLIRGERDDWYSAAKLEADVNALRARGVEVMAHVVAAGHEWQEDADRTAGEFLRRAARAIDR